jgi:hypothetical protein
MFDKKGKRQPLSSHTIISLLNKDNVKPKMTIGWCLGDIQSTIS